jgi:hypothetical protein
MGAIEERVAPHHDLAHVRAPGRIQHVHRAHAFELVRPSHRVRRGRQEREVHDRVHTLCGEDLADAILRRRLRQIDVIDAGFLTGGLRGLDIHADDAPDARVFFEQSDEISPQKRRRTRDGDRAAGLPHRQRVVTCFGHAGRRP